MGYARLNLMRSTGPQIQISAEKTSVHIFKRSKGLTSFTHVTGQGRAGLEYLGFRFDGERVYLRTSTLTNLNRKVAEAAKRNAFALVARNPGKDLSALKGLFNYEAFVKRFGRVEDFAERSPGFNHWTFWTYSQRATKCFGPKGRAIQKQLRRFRQNVEKRVNSEIEYAHIRLN